MKEINVISGGVDVYYQSTLVYNLSKRFLLRKSFRKEKIERIFN
jgi:hypothetical protein